METLVSLVTGSLGGGIAIWLLRNWITERLHRSIEHEYAAQLETHKAELTSKLAALSHEYEAHRQRTSLLFDHRRSAFANVLAAAVELRDAWEAAYDPDEDYVGAVPSEPFKNLRSTFYAEQLYLDRSAIAAVELIIETATQSFPFVDPSGEHTRDGQAPLEQVSYMLPLVAALFRDRLGLEANALAERKIALLGAILLINRYHFAEIGLPVTGDLALTDERAADAVAKADRHAESLLAKLRQFQVHLEDRQLGVFHKAATNLSRYIDVLETTMPASRTLTASRLAPTRQQGV